MLVTRREEGGEGSILPLPNAGLNRNAEYIRAGEVRSDAPTPPIVKSGGVSFHGSSLLRAAFFFFNNSLRSAVPGGEGFSDGCEVRAFVCNPVPILGLRGVGKLVGALPVPTNPQAPVDPPRLSLPLSPQARWTRASSPASTCCRAWGTSTRGRSTNASWTRCPSFPLR